MFAFADASIVFTPTPDDVETLESETRRIDLGMAARAFGALTMLGELITDGGRPTNIGLDGFHVNRRFRWRRAEDSIEHPGAAQYRRSRCSVRRHLHNACHRHDTASMAVF